MRDLIDKISLLESTGNKTKLASKLHYENGKIVFYHLVDKPTIVKFNFSKPFELRIQYIKMHFLIDKNGNLVHDTKSHDIISVDSTSDTALSNFVDYGDTETVYQKAFMPLFIDAGISQSAAENFIQDREAIDHGLNRPSEVEEEINAAYQWRQETIGDLG